MRAPRGPSVVLVLLAAGALGGCTGPSGLPGVSSVSGLSEPSGPPEMPGTPAVPASEAVAQPSGAAPDTSGDTFADTSGVTSAGAAPDPVLTPARIAARASVRLRNVGCSGVETGSGFAVDAHTLVTNAHVVAKAQQVQVDTWDGRAVDVTASQVATVADLAVVRTREALPAAVPLASADPAAGESVSVVGYPRGQALARVAGTVVGPVDDPLRSAAGQVLAVDADVAPGSSGSAVLDASGAVVGVVYAGAVTGRHAYAVPVSVLKAALEGVAASASSSPSARC